ncbi:MAG: HD domain-containing protein [bacterium]
MTEQKHSQSLEKTVPKPDITDPQVQRKMLLEQEPKILEAASMLATRIKAVPLDPRFPDLEPKALIVGGFVRDALLNKNPKDADIEVYGLMADRLEMVLEQLFPGKVNMVGRAFGIYKIAAEPGIEFDVSIPRYESKTGPNHDDIKVTGVPSMTIKEAVRRRDFSWNALAADPLSGEVFDYFNGASDLKNGILRATDPERFQDDPLRVYRAIQFSARMGLKVEPESFKLMTQMVERGDLDYVKPERISSEIQKLLLKSEKPSIGLELARELGIVEKYFPEMQALIGLEQEKEWHPEGDVWTHTMMVLDAAAKIIKKNPNIFSENEKLSVMIGSICHDFGKATTTKFENGRIRSSGHEAAGEEPALRFLKRLKIGDEIVAMVKAIVVEHLQPGVLYRARIMPEEKPGSLNARQYTNAVRKCMKRIGRMPCRVFLAASEADHRGRTVPGVADDEYTEGLLFEEAVARFGLDKEAAKPLVGGVDIIKIAGELGLAMKQGPQIGFFQKKIEEKRDSGDIVTREEGLKLLREMLQTVKDRESVNA